MSEHEDGASAPTNKELAAEAKTLGDELGVEVTTAGLNKAALLELVEGLRAQRAERAAGEGGETDAKAADSDSSEGAPPTAGPIAGVVRAEEGSKDSPEPPTKPPADSSDGPPDGPPDLREARRRRLGAEVEAELDALADTDEDLAIAIGEMLETDQLSLAPANAVERAQVAAGIAYMRELAREVGAGSPAAARALLERVASLGGIPVAESPAEASGGYRVARGRSVTTRRGIRGPGEDVREDDFRGDGAARMVELERAGVLTRA